MARVKIRIPDGIAVDDVEKAIRDFDAGVEHKFGRSTFYDLVFEGRAYPPKAIMGLASRRLMGRTLVPNEVDEGRDSKCFKTLENLGFEIVLKERMAEASDVGVHGGDGSDALHDLVPDPEMRKEVAAIFSESIEVAHEINDAVWVLTHEKQEPYINLNVGRVFALTLRRGKLNVLFDLNKLKASAADRESWETPENEQDEFKSLSNATWRQGPLDEFVAAWDQLRDAHLSAVRRAATQVSRAPTFKHHQADLVRVIGEIRGRPLPQPDYGDEASLWVVRAGEEGQAHQQFISDSVVALGWNEMGDVVGLTLPDEIRERFRETYPDAPEGKVNNCSTGIFGFLSKITVGDVVLYPEKGEDHVLLGVVTGPAAHNPEGRYTTVRPVRWLSRVPRKSLPDEIKSHVNLPPSCFEISEPGADFREMVREGELYADLAKSFLEMRERDDEDGEEVRRHSKEHRLRHDNWLKILDSDAADRDALLAALKDTDWHYGAKKTNAPGVIETQEKADNFLGQLKAIISSPPTNWKELKAAIKTLPEGFSLGFVSEFFVYALPDQYWELNSPIREAITLIGFKGLEDLPRGKRNDFQRYFAMEPLVDGLRSALDLAGLKDPSYLDVDLLLWELARKPANFPGLPMRIDEAALSALIDDLRSWHPSFTTFDEPGSTWWEDERGYKEDLGRLFQEQVLDGTLKVVGGLEWALDVIRRIRSVLTKSLGGGSPQNLMSWRFWQFLKPLQGNDEQAVAFATAFRELLVGEASVENRVEAFNRDFVRILDSIKEPANPAVTRSFPTLFLMLLDPANEIFIRTTEFHDVFKALTGISVIGDGPLDAGEYSRAKTATRALFDSLANRGLRPADHIDIQSFLHVVAARNTWILQANPETWDLNRFLEDGHREVAWSLPKLAGEVRENDTVYLWASGEGRGIVAKGTTATAALTRDEVPDHVWEIDQQYYSTADAGPNAEKYVLVDLESVFPEQRIFGDQLKGHEVLKDLTILKQPAGTVFRVNKQQAVALHQMTRDGDTNGRPPLVTFNEILASLRTKGLYFPDELVANYLLALQTKRFAILTGISGTGKTQLAMAVAEAFPLRRKERVAEAPVSADTLEYTVKPYMLKYGGMVVPSEAARQIDLEVLAPDGGRSRLPTKFDGQTMGLTISRDVERNVTYLSFRGPFREWFNDTFARGDTFHVIQELNEDGLVVGLRFERPGETTQEEVIENSVVIAVRPDWTDHRGLLGYHNPLTGQYVMTPFLELIMRAGDECKRAEEEGREPAPFFAVLDEMNLARVEHYFSDLLSCMESGKPIHLHDDEAVAAGETEDGVMVPKDLALPPNLFVVGTVNVDETTYMFSPKVLDRAFTIELNEVDLGGYAAGDFAAEGADGGLRLPAFKGLAGEWEKPNTTDWRELGKLDGGKYQGWVVRLNEILEADGRHFGYRVADEISRFVTLAADQADGNEGAIQAAFDIAVLEKVLPKMNGTQQELHGPIENLFAFAMSPDGSWKKQAPSDLIPAGNEFVGKIQAAPAENEAEDNVELHSPENPPPVLPRTARKLWRMARRLKQRGFVSYIE